MEFGRSTMLIKLTTKEDVSLRESVLQTLRQAILCGELKPGERLMEIQLSEALGVSRTPIREAIRKLEQEGLVIVERNKGATVAPITERDLIDVLEVREVLDELSVELACKHMTEREITLLDKNLKAFLCVMETKNPEKITENDVEFHDIIYNSTGNLRLSQMMHHIQQDMYRYRLEYIRVDDTYQSIYEEHRLIADSIRVKDVAKAKEAIRKHLEKQKQTIVKNLRRDG